MRAPQILLWLTAKLSEQRRTAMLFLGIDWGEHPHDLCLLNQDGAVLAVHRITDGLAGVEELHALVAAHADGPDAGRGRHRDRPGPAGRRAGGRRLPGVCGQPQAVSRYRGRHRAARAKSDRSDAKVLADLVRTDRHNHRPVAGDSPLAEAVKVLARGTRTSSGAGSGTSTRCAAPCGSSTPARWPRWVSHVGLGQVAAGGVGRPAAGVGGLGVARLQRLHGQVPGAHGVGAGQDLAAEPPGTDAPREPIVGLVEHHDPAAAEALFHQLLWCPPGRRRHLRPAHA
jgi:hypothetical protein